MTNMQENGRMHHKIIAYYIRKKCKITPANFTFIPRIVSQKSELLTVLFLNYNLSTFSKIR